MDPWLAKIYNTNGASEITHDDIEKVAQYHLLEKLAEEEGIDLSALSPEQIEELAAQTTATETVDDGTGDAGQFVDPTGQYTPEQQQKIAQAKFDEADWLGRVMAHAQNDEAEKIAMQKTAGTFPRAGVGRMVDKGKHHAGRAANAVRGAAGKAGNFAKGKMDAAKNSKAGKAVSDHVGRNEGRYGAGIIAGGAFGAGRASKREKTASAFEKLAELRAGEILGAAGVTPEQHQQVMQQQALQGQQQPQGFHPALGGGQPQGQPGAGQVDPEQFQGLLDERALSLLAENGYDVDAIVDHLSGGQGGEGGQDQGQQ